MSGQQQAKSLFAGPAAETGVGLFRLCSSALFLFCSSLVNEQDDDDDDDDNDNDSDSDSDNA